jgi:YbbR domain-containing protein
MRRLLGIITYNWPLKLMAIVLATLLYAGLVVSQSTFTFDTSPIPIRAVNQPTNAVLLVNLPPVNRIRYVSSGEAGVGPTPDSFQATVDLSGVDPNAGSVFVNVNVVSTDPRFLVRDWEPRTISVLLDPFSKKIVPVQVKTGLVADNLDVRPPVLSVQNVEVSGPDSVVKFVVAAEANVAIDPQGLNIDRDIPLIAVDVLGNAKSPVKIDPPSVHVQIAVFTNAKTKALPVKPDVTGTPPTGYVVDTVTVDPPIVTVEGDPPELATVQVADTQPIPIGGITGTISVDVPLALPAGVLPIGLETVHVTITVKPETGTATFTAGPVLVGRQPGLDYQLSTGSVLVTIGGPKADLDRLNSSALTVNLDVTGLGVGTHEIQPTLNLQAGLRLLNVDPLSVTVTITSLGSPAPSASGG